MLIALFCPFSGCLVHGRLLINLLIKSVLLTIDAVALKDFFIPDPPISPVEENGEEYIASTRKLLDLVEMEHVSLVIFGHDHSQWVTLKQLPEFLD